MTTPATPTDTQLLKEALRLLEWVTWHDGRYDQLNAYRWQRKAQSFVRALANHLNRTPYQGYK